MKKLLSTLTAVIGLGAVFAPPVATATENIDPTMVVLDASGSMTTPDVDGQTRMDAAKHATREFIDNTPDNAPLGLVTYGTNTGSGDEEKEAGCKDITVLATPGEKDKTKLKTEVDRLNPRGYTPIGNALLKANEQLPQEGKRSIVLVSDGVDTCAPPPVCEVAKQLKNQGTDLVIHTIGFKVDDTARAELTCIAEATGGTYSDSSSAQTLKETLTKVTTRNAVGYKLPETRFEFSESVNNVQPLEVGTLDNPMQIDVKLPNSRHSYAKISIPKGYRLQGGITLPPDETGTVNSASAQDKKRSVSLTLGTKNGVTCSKGDAANDTNGGIVESGFFTSRGVEEDQDCGAGDFIIEATNNWNTPKHVVLTLAQVPEPNNIGDPFNQQPSPAVRSSDMKPAAAQNEQPTQPLRFPDPSAPEVAGTITSEIVEGETQFFATPIHYGQSLQVTAEIIDDPSAETARSFRELRINFLNSLHQKLRSIGTDRMTVMEGESPEVVSTEFPISYANTTSESTERAASWLGGKHFVQVSFPNPNRENDTNANTQLRPVKYRLTFTPVGKAVEGPKFENTSGAATTTTTSSNAAPIDAAPTSESSNTGKYIAGGIGAIALIAVIAAVVGIARRRKAVEG